jgi:manganese/zinc/iron transport system permease protein
LREDILGVLYRVEEHPGASNVEVSSGLLGDAIGAGALDIRVAVRQLLRGGQLERQGTHFRITGSGREKARGLVRAHRLWENYLVEHLHLAADHIHPTAEQLEHITDTAMQDQLVQDTRRPDRDPHGRDIPPALD